MSFSVLKENHLINKYLLSIMYLQATMLYPGDSLVTVADSLSGTSRPLLATPVGPERQGVFYEDREYF